MILGENFKLWDFTTWPLIFGVIFGGVILLGLEILSRLIHILFSGFKRIPNKGRHLDTLETIDWCFIFINKMSMITFVYNGIQIIYYTPTILKRPEELTLANTVGSLILFYIFYDFFYHVCAKLLQEWSLFSS